MPAPAAKPCQHPGCTRAARGPGERYCQHHAEEVRRQLERARYLTPAPPARAAYQDWRGRGGLGCPEDAWDGVVRAVEG